METLGYSDFSIALSRKVAEGGRRVPLHASIELTRRCPLTCQHCYNNLPMADAEARRAELSLDEYERLFDQLASAGCLWLLLTGGEILARKDFLAIYDAAKARGFLITLFTNGILVDERIADHLARAKPFSIEVTLYGATRETYEALTRVPGSYDRCMRGVRLLAERGLPLKLKTVAVTTNVHEIAAMRAIAEGLGVSFKYDGQMNPRIDCSQSPLEVRLGPEEIVALDLADPDRLAKWREYAHTYAGERGRTIAPKDGEVYHCGGGVQSFAIDPAGRMSLCVLSQVDTYDVRDGKFQDGWDHFLGEVRARKATRPSRCTTCALKALCGMCPAQGELENQDAESPVEFLCEVGHLRAHAFELAVPEHGDCPHCSAAGRASMERKLERTNTEAARLVASFGEHTPAGPVRADGRLRVLADSAGGCGSC